MTKTKIIKFCCYHKWNITFLFIFTKNFFFFTKFLCSNICRNLRIARTLSKVFANCKNLSNDVEYINYKKLLKFSDLNHISPLFHAIMQLFKKNTRLKSIKILTTKISLKIFMSDKTNIVFSDVISWILTYQLEFTRYVCNFSVES